METKKMTKTQAQEFVKNTKYIVFNEDESKQLQTKLFEIGCYWFGYERKVKYLEGKFIFVNNNLCLSYGTKGCCKTFDETDKEIRNVDDVISVEIEEPKPKFDPRTLKPFDKVLVKNEGEIWNVDFYDRYNSEAETYLCIGGLYSFCIPYNEETKYLHGNGNKEPEFYQQD